MALCLVPLEPGAAMPGEVCLPPCPVIGVGDRFHPFAAHCDAVIEAPVTAQGMVRQILAQPLAASALVQLLRILPRLPAEQGLAMESMAYAMLQGSAGHSRWLAARRDHVATAPGRIIVAREGDAMAITLERTGAGNAIDRAMRDALHQALSLAVLDESIATVRLLGRGRTFSLGADLAEFGTTRDPATAHDIRQRSLPALAAWRCADRMEARIQGACVGAGLELAAFARRIVAAPDAWFQLPELAMGIIPGAGGCVSLTRRIGRQRTALLVLSGRRISARTALSWGLIDGIEHALPGDEGCADAG